MTCSTMYIHSTGPATLLGSGRWWWLNSGSIPSPTPGYLMTDQPPTTNRLYPFSFLPTFLPFHSSASSINNPQYTSPGHCAP